MRIESVCWILMLSSLGRWRHNMYDENANLSSIGLLRFRNGYMHPTSWHFISYVWLISVLTHTAILYYCWWLMAFTIWYIISAKTRAHEWWRLMTKYESRNMDSWLNVSKLPWHILIRLISDSRVVCICNCLLNIRHSVEFIWIAL